MKVNDLNLVASPDRKRVGRGIGSGYGKTAGRGTKGQKARTGGNIRIGFEGGQNPLAKRLPKKRGFASINPIRYQTVSLTQLNNFDEKTTIDAPLLASRGYVKHPDRRVKLLATGEIAKPMTIHLQAGSKAAIAAVEKAGGTFAVTSLPKPPKIEASQEDTKTRSKQA